MQRVTETKNVGRQDILHASEAHSWGSLKVLQLWKRERFQPAWQPLLWAVPGLLLGSSTKITIITIKKGAHISSQQWSAEEEEVEGREWRSRMRLLKALPLQIMQLSIIAAKYVFLISQRGGGSRICCSSWIWASFACLKGRFTPANSACFQLQPNKCILYILAKSCLNQQQAEPKTGAKRHHEPWKLISDWWSVAFEWPPPPPCWACPAVGHLPALSGDPGCLCNSERTTSTC